MSEEEWLDVRIVSRRFRLRAGHAAIAHECFFHEKEKEFLTITNL